MTVKLVIAIVQSLVVQVFVLKSNRVQRWLGLRRDDDLDDQHVKKDIKKLVEDQKDQAKSKA